LDARPAVARGLWVAANAAPNSLGRPVTFSLGRPVTFVVTASLIVRAIILDDTPIARRLGSAHPAAVQNERIGGARPLLCRQGTAELILDDHCVVGIGNPEAVGYPKHGSIHRKARDLQRMAEHDGGCLTADAGKRRQLFEIQPAVAA